MSLDLAVLTRANGASFDQAVAVYSEQESGTTDAYDDDNWPFAGDPIVESGFVLLTVAPEAWESEVPRLVERAHKRDLIVLDPQWGGEGKLFPPGEAYA
jgi:hypothetical protein